MKKVDIVGMQFGRITVKGEGLRNNNNRRTVICSCACGKEFTTDPRDMMRGFTKSCGCLQKEAVSKSSSERLVHGKCRTAEYNSWQGMKSRCLNPLNKKYPSYGGRGITVCKEWASDFEKFISDMGHRPRGNFSIDRIDVNGNYEPNNCRWADPKTQSRNKRNTRLVLFGDRMTPLAEACEISGVKYTSAVYRLNNGGNWQPLPEQPPC